MIPNTSKEIWTLHPKSSQIEGAYNDHLYCSLRGGPRKVIFSTDTDHEINFLTFVEASEDLKEQRLVGRFQGDKISYKDLENTLSYNNLESAGI